MGALLSIFIIILGFKIIKNINYLTKSHVKKEFLFFITIGISLYAMSEFLRYFAKAFFQTTCYFAIVLHIVGALSIIFGLKYLWCKTKAWRELDAEDMALLGFFLFGTLLYLAYLLFESKISVFWMIFPTLSAIAFLLSYVINIHYEKGTLRRVYKDIASGIFFIFLGDMFYVYHNWIFANPILENIYWICYVIAYLLFTTSMYILIQQEKNVRKHRERTHKKIVKELERKKLAHPLTQNKKKTNKSKKAVKKTKKTIKKKVKKK